jgi:subfamily B ATP-binding cassette protein MsbA
MKQDTFQRLFKHYLLPYKSEFFLAIVCMVLSSLATAALPYLIKPLFDRVLFNMDINFLVMFCFIIFVTFLLKGIGGYGENVILSDVGQRIIIDVQLDLFKKILNGDFLNKSSGDLVCYFTSNITILRGALTNTIIGIGRDFFTLFFLILLMFYRDFTLSCGTFIVFPVVIIPIVKISRKMKKVFYSNQHEMGELSSSFIQIFQNIRIVKSFVQENDEYQRAKSQMLGFLDTFKKSAHMRSLSSPIIEIIGALGIVGVIAYGGYQILHNQKTPGDFISFITAMIFSYDPLKRLSNLNSSLQEGLVATKRIFELMDTPDMIDNPQSPLPLPSPIKGRISFMSVTFGYHEKILFKNLSFHVEPGEKIAFVGPSGAGKSTLINLICRFIDPWSGDICLDNINIKKLNLNDLRSQISLVSQEIGLFNRTVFDNISYGRIDVNLDDVMCAAKKAGAHHFIQQLENGYDTFIGEHGSKLSGGQRQRLAIARALLKNAPILLLDEATSSLDSQSEQAIQETLETMMEGKTTIIVAHRLSTVKHCDRIYVLDHGMIQEQGNHQTLLSKEGLYYRLFHGLSS